MQGIIIGGTGLDADVAGCQTFHHACEKKDRRTRNVVRYSGDKEIIVKPSSVELGIAIRTYMYVGNGVAKYH